MRNGECYNNESKNGNKRKKYNKTKEKVEIRIIMKKRYQN